MFIEPFTVQMLWHRSGKQERIQNIPGKESLLQYVQESKSSAQLLCESERRVLCGTVCSRPGQSYSYLPRGLSLGFENSQQLYNWNFFISGLLCQNEELCEGSRHAGWWYRHRHSVHSHYRHGPVHGSVLHDRLVAGNLSSSSPILHSPKCTVQLCCKFVFPLPSNYNSIILLFVFFFLLASTKHFLAVPRFPHSHNKHRCLHNCKLIQNTCSTIHYARETLSLRCLHHHQSDNGSQAEQHEKNRTKILFSRMLNSFMHTSYKNNEG